MNTNWLFKKLVAAIFVITMIFGAASGTLFGQMTQSQRPDNWNDANAGTAQNPYRISSLENLRWLSESENDWWVNASTPVHFRQTANINARDTRNWNQGAGFKPIGYQLGNDVLEKHFIGVYDGDNFTISDLYINKSGADRIVGLFSRVTGISSTNKSVVMNLGLTNVSISVSGEDRNNTTAGGIVGWAKDADIINSYTSGTIHAAAQSWTEKLEGGTNAGGIAGRTHGNTVISYSYSTANISVLATAGGAGHWFSAGGLVGVAKDNTRINDCYAGGNTTATRSGSPTLVIAYAGGIVGRIGGSSRIIRCYATGRVNASVGGLLTTNYNGGIAGWVFKNSGDNVTIQDSIWDTQTTGRSKLENGSYTGTNNKGLNTANMQTMSNYPSSWNFNLIWQMSSGQYPRFRSLLSPPRSLTTQAAINGIILSWTAPDRIIGTVAKYNIYRRVGTGNWSLIHTTDGAQTTSRSWTDVSVVANTSYSYEITAVYTAPNGESGRSNQTNPVSRRLYEPRNLTASITPGSVQLNWQVPVSTTPAGSLRLTYNIERSIGSGSYSRIASNIYGTGSQNMAYQDTDVSALTSQEYYYRVVVVWGIYTSAPSNVASVSLNAVLSNPRELTLSLGSESIKLNWQVPGLVPNNGTLTYGIDKKIDNGNFYRIASNISGTSYDDPDLNGLVTHDYTYRVVAVWGIHTSTPSNERSVSGNDIPKSAPQNLTYVVSLEESSITLNWDVPDDVGAGTVTGYRVYRNDIEIGPAGSLYYIDYNYLPFEENTYFVRAVYANPARISDNSNTVTVNLSQYYEPEHTSDPRAPMFVRAAHHIGGGVEISWEKPLLANPDGYIIFRAMIDGSEEELPVVHSANVRRFIDTLPFAPHETHRIYGVRAFYNGSIGGERTTGSSQSITLNEDRTVGTSHGVNYGIEVGYSAGFHIVANVGGSHEWSESRTIGTAIGNEIIQSETFSWSAEALPSDIERVIIVNTRLNEPENLAFAPPVGLYANEVFLTWDAPVSNPNNQLVGYYVYRDGVRVNIAPGEYLLMPHIRQFPDNIGSSQIVIGLDYTYHVTAVYDTASGRRESRPSIPVRAYTTGGIRPPTLSSTDPLNSNEPGNRLNPYLISHISHLRWISEFAQIRNNTDGWASNPFTEIHFRQVQDIDASETRNWHY